jgi:hypothetical protein
VLLAEVGGAIVVILMKGRRVLMFVALSAVRNERGSIKTIELCALRDAHQKMVWLVYSLVFPCLTCC